MPISAAADCPASPRSRSTVTPRLAGRRLGRGSPVTTAISLDAPAPVAGRARTSANIAWARAWRAPATERRREPLLRGFEALDREDGDRAHESRASVARLLAARGLACSPGPCRDQSVAANSRALPATRARASGVSMSVSVDQRRAVRRPARRPPCRRSRPRRPSAIPLRRAAMPACSQNASVGPFSTSPAHERADRHDRRGRGRQRLAHAGQRQDRADRDRPGSTGRSRSRRRSAMASSASGVGVAALDARAGPRLDRSLRRRSTIMNSWNGRLRPRRASRGCGPASRSSAARAPRRPSPARPRRAPRSGARPLASALRADQAHRQVAVAEAEPGGRPARSSAPITSQVSSRMPVAALVDHVGEPVGHEVRVGRDVHAVDLHVVAGVGDHRQVGRADHVEQPAGELGPAGPAGEERYYQSASGSPVSLIPACVLWRTFTEISSGVRPSIEARRLEAAGVDRAQAVDPARSARPRARLSSLRVAGDEHVLVELLRRGRPASARSPCAARSPPSTPSGTISWACSRGGALRHAEQARGLARHRGRERHRRVHQDLARAQHLLQVGQVLRLVAERDAQQDDRARAWPRRRSRGRSTSASGTCSRTLRAASSARPASREPITTGPPRRREPQGEAEAERAGAADDRDGVGCAHRPAAIGPLVQGEMECRAALSA